MTSPQPIRIKTITEYHRVTGLPKPEHPLVSVINLEELNPPTTEGAISLIFDFYSITIKRVHNIKFKYGQQPLDFDEGVLFCMAPGQLFSFEIEKGTTHRPSGWMIFIHPDFLWNTPLAKTIKQYDYFNYSVSEALYLSDKEETTMNGIIQYMNAEYHSNIDRFSQSVIIAQIELLLTYTERFYQRQFITRKISSHQLIGRLEDVLTDYFKGDALAEQGIPTVKHIAKKLNVSPNYLSSLLKILTGQNAQQLIHSKLIEKAKEKLSTTSLSISEIAYELGFEHSQSFSKLFKNKTTLSPLQFRQSFN